MAQYEIIIEESEDYEILERNYKDLLIYLINSSIGEAGENEKSNNLLESINGGAS